MSYAVQEILPAFIGGVLAGGGILGLLRLWKTVKDKG